MISLQPFHFMGNLFFHVESDKCRDLSEAIGYPPKTMFEDVQFPPVATVRSE